MTETPDRNCYTLPNGDCVSDKPCMHSTKATEVELRSERRKALYLGITIGIIIGVAMHPLVLWVRCCAP